MITSTKALKIILNSSADFGTELIPFIESTGRILKENVVADRDLPPFDRVSMDGIAIDISAFNKGQRQFKIEGVQAAGSPQLSLQNTENCIEAMTGAMLPKNTNAVIQYELTETKDGFVTLKTNEVKFYKNIHKKGLDCTKGTALIAKNKVISAAEIGVLATVGKSLVKVAKQPTICIISTGDELVEVAKIPLPHQIRRSNVFTLVALLKRLNLKADTLHIKDDKTLLKQKVAQALNSYDVLLFSGAVSKGKFDFIPDVLNDLGVVKLFHRVKQKPGKPFWFGKKEHKTVFAFPGNPVSTFVSCLKYFHPWYYKSVGVAIPVETAILASDFEFKSPLTYFLQVTLENKNGCMYAYPLMGNGSGDLANLAVADAFIELPSDETEFKKGTVFSVLGYR